MPLRRPFRPVMAAGALAEAAALAPRSRSDLPAEKAVGLPELLAIARRDRAGGRDRGRSARHPAVAKRQMTWFAIKQHRI